jgi:hypothetical protein
MICSHLANCHVACHVLIIIVWDWLSMTHHIGKECLHSDSSLAFGLVVMSAMADMFCYFPIGVSES